MAINPMLMMQMAGRFKKFNQEHPKGCFTKGFYSLEKFGIVVTIGYAVFSCLLGSSTAPIQL